MNIELIAVIVVGIVVLWILVLIAGIRKALSSSVDHNFQSVVQPLNDHLIQFNEQLKSIDLANRELRYQTNQLVQAFGKPQFKGEWGENTLRNILESMGMKRGFDFFEQPLFRTDTARTLRPDVVIKLTKRRNLIIDSKTPIEAYQAAMNARDKRVQAKYFKDHAKALRKQVAELKKRNYPKWVPHSPEFTVLFLPSEALYAAAVEHDQELLQFAIGCRVIITTPWTLVMLIKVIEFGWRQEELTDNVKEIVEKSQALYDVLTSFTEKMATHGKTLERSVASYNSATRAFENKVLKIAKELERLQIATPSQKLETPNFVETIVKHPKQSK